MNGLLAILVVLVCVLGAATVCLTIIAHDNKKHGSSVPAQRRHDREYAPAGTVYVVLQTTYNETHNYYHDNRSVHVGHLPQAVCPGTLEGEPGQWAYLPGQRQDHCLTG